MFDFLFSNPIIIIILIGVISSIIKKKNKPNQQKTGQPQAAKPIWKEVIQELQEEWLEEKKKIPKTIQEARQVLPTDVTKSDEEAERKRLAEPKRLEQEYEGKYDQEMASKPEPSAPTVFPAASVARGTRGVSRSTISDEKSPVYNKELSFGKQELINGIIMSEVLGPPRAKRSLKQSRQ